jgi:integrase
MAKHKLNDNDRVSEPSAKKLAALLASPGKHADGNGLYLQVAAPGQGSWVSRLGERWKSLGPADELTAKAARTLHETRKAEYSGTAKAISAGFGKALEAGTKAEAEAEAKTVVEPEPERRERVSAVVEQYLAINAPTWKPTNRDREAHNYRKLAATDLGPKWIDVITSADVAEALSKEWGHALVSCDKARMRLMQVIAFAVAKGLRADGPNPARKEVIKHLVQSAPKSTPHVAMPLAQVPSFVGKLRADGSPDARSLAFLIHTAARTAEAIGADWSEISGNVWTIPGSRMKEGKPHSVPLSSAALALLGKPKSSGLIFGALAHDALIDALKKLGGDFTVHGFRSAFVGWAAKKGYSKDLRDRAIAHAVGDANDQAYDRDRLIEERRPMMQAWADFLTAR